MSPFSGISLVFLNVYLLLSVNSETVQEDEDTNHRVKCDAVECQKLRNRVEILEAAVRDIALALTSEKKGQFGSINKILERSTALRTLVNKPSETLTLSVPQLITSESGQEKKSTLHLKEILKCSLATLLDIHTPEIGTNTSAAIEASVVGSNSLEIKWSISSDCVKFSHGVWIRVTESGESRDSIENNKHLSVPHKCLKKLSKSTFSVVLSPPTNTTTREETNCNFELKHRLIPCLSYFVEVVPNFHSLKGKTMTSKVIVPPTNDDKTSMKSLISVSYSSDKLMLNWEDNSGCSAQLTSFHLNIIPDGELPNNHETAVSSVKIPRSCLNLAKRDSNLFSVVLSSSFTCPIMWKPLNVCRKYKLEMKSQYSDTWTGSPSSWEIFTVQQGTFNGIASHQWICQKDQYFHCDGHNSHYHRGIHGSCLEIGYVCDGGISCRNGTDELNCDHQCNRDGFRCGRQCVPRSKICDGKFDCFDGADEPYECENTPLVSCYHLTTNYGRLSSQFTLGEKEFIHSSHNPVQKSAVLITVRPNHTIWLAFNKFNTEDAHFLRAYDGPYSTSPLIMEHSGSTKPFSVRSSSNNVYVIYPSYPKEEFGVDLFYTSMEDINPHASVECGGYIYGEGVVSLSNITYTNATVCIWYVETRQNDVTILLKRHFLPARLPSFRAGDVTVFDGWSTSGQQLHSFKATSSSNTNAIYSISNKMLVQLTLPNPVRNGLPAFSFNVTSNISTTRCQESFHLESGTIKTPNYPIAYPNLSDCRWYINTAPNSKIRILFALFETQEGFDYVFVYDGPTMSSPLLLEKSGLLATPFTINSSTNELLVRFTSDDHTNDSGFLAVYSTISD